MGRNINIETKRKLAFESRSRCTIGGHIIFDDVKNLDLLEKVLDKHHILHVKEGGPNTFDNLIVVCPNCHRKIHARRDIYKDKLIEEAKYFWGKMRYLVPEEMIYEDGINQNSFEGWVNIKFKLLTPNLTFIINTPPNITINELINFIQGWIIRPLKMYCNLSPFPTEFGRMKTKNSKISFFASQGQFLEGTSFISDYDFQMKTIVLSADITTHAALCRPTLQDGLSNITLRWNEIPKDLDLHLAVYSGNNLTKVDYGNLGNLEQFPFAKLNKDVTTGLGPETVSIGVKSKFQYLIYVHNYSSELPLSDSNAIVDFELAGNKQTIRINPSGKGRYWIVGTINIESGVIKEINKIVEKNPIHNDLG